MINQLSSLALQELKLLFGVEDELEKLKNSILKLRVKLLGAEEQQAKNEDIKNFLMRIKDAVYDADDLIDEFTCEALMRQWNEKVCRFFSKSNPLSFRLQMAHKIKKLSEIIDKFTVEIGELNIIEHIKDVRDEQIRERETGSFIIEEEVIGRDDEKNAIMTKLFDPNVKENVSVIAIVGIGGLGKTALAQCLYNSNEVANHFELKMWVCVSEVFDVKKVVGKIIESATKKKLTEMQELDALQSQMRREIEGKKYLLVMDDVWNEDDEKWMKLVKLLLGGARGSRIVISTRSRRVAEIARPISVFPIQGLSEGNSWLLLEKMAFVNGEGDGAKDQKLIEIGKEIVKKLNGVPLLIRTIGRVLYFKTSTSEWISFRDNELPSTIIQEENGIISILKISYNNLPTHLKQCFAYCSLFPKDFLIGKSELIKLWIAQGFIDQSKCQDKYSMEDVGHDYFMELFWRSFFQDMQRDEWGNIQEFKMHDLIHDLGQLILGGEHMLVRDKNVKNISNKQIRHVSFDIDSIFDWQLPSSILEAKKLRSLLFPTQKSFASRSLNKQVFTMFISYFVHLRALNLRCLWIDAVPKSIDKLKHLRYIDLSENLFIKSLPNSITKLRSLQTLDLSNCRSLRKLPKNTSDLVNLRHLVLDGCDNMSHMPPRLSRLICLQTIYLFVLGKKCGCGLDELKGLDNLRGKLVIRGLESLRCNKEKALASKYAELKEKQGLRKIELNWSSLETNYEGPVDDTVLDNLQPHPNVQILGIKGYSGVRLSNWVNSISNSVEISINNCERLQFLPQFEQLPLLQSLRLRELTCLEYIDNNSGSLSSSSTKTMFFPSLRTLSLIDLPELKKWCMRDFVTERSFPRLSNLSISCCRKFSSIPSHPPLETLELEWTSMNILELIMATTSTSSHTMSSSSSPVIPRLKRLVLSHIDKMEHISDELLQNFISLNDLRISHCCDFQMSLSRLVQHLPTVNNLYIENCFNIDIFNNLYESMQWKALRSLRSLSLQTLSRLVSLPDGLQHVSTLQILELSDCVNLTNLPEWISNFTSLSVLKITYCKNLKSLPKGMRRLTSLQELVIYGCHLDMKERCKRETGEDWPLVADIPNLTVL